MKTVALIGLLLVSCTKARQGLSDGHFWCTDAQREVTKCSKKLEPVLGVFNDGTTQRFNNECEACINPAVDSFYLVTQCTRSLINQDSDGSSSVGVCAISLEGYLQDYRDEFYACDANMESFFRGHCPRKVDSSITYCPANPKAKLMCYMLYMPVCVTTTDGSKRTASNGCTACTAEDSLYYEKGSCETGDTGIKPVPTPILRLPTNVPTTDDTSTVHSQPMIPVTDDNTDNISRVHSHPMIPVTDEETTDTPIRSSHPMIPAEDPVSVSTVQALIQKKKNRKL